jgi:hypothetical protein
MFDRKKVLPVELKLDGHGVAGRFRTGFAMVGNALNARIVGNPPRV